MAEAPKDPNAKQPIDKTLPPVTATPIPTPKPPTDSVDTPKETGSASSITDVNFTPKRRSVEQIKYNPLDDYLDVTYNISLGMVGWEALQRLQKDTIQKAKLEPNDYIIFASTGEQATDRDRYQGDYYNIKSFSFTNFLGHIPQNPMVAIMWDGKMKMVQPYGFSFREDIDTMAKTLKYPQMTPLAFCYRMEIWFSGYTKEGTWVSRIPIPIYDKKNSETNSVIYYLSITTVEARITSIGTEYDLSFQTMSHYATRAENIVIHATKIGTGKLAYSQGQKFSDFLLDLGKELQLQIKADSEGQLKVGYEFYGPDWLFNEPFSAAGAIDFKSGITYNDSSGTYAFSGNNIDLYTLLNHVSNALPLVRKLHERKDDPAFKKPGCLWNIRTNIAEISEPSRADNGVNGYHTYRFQYIIEPVMSFRSRTTPHTTRNQRVDVASQEARAKAIVEHGMLVRIYKYLFSERNSEVIDFQFRYKNFYYETFVYADVDASAPAVGAMTNNPDWIKQQEEQRPQVNIFPTGSGNFVLTEVIPNTASPATKQQAMNRVPNMPASQSLSATEKDSMTYLKSKDQYMRFDMLDANITVRFDPTWLLNAYVSGGDFTPELPSDVRKDGVFVNVHVDRVVYIEAFRPNQKDYMNPTAVTSPPNRSAIIGGYYQVIHIVNEFDGGKCVQKINLLKYPHLNYYTGLFLEADKTEISSSSQMTSGTGTDVPDSNATKSLGG